MTNYKGPTKLVLVIRCSSHQDLLTIYMYTTTANQMMLGNYVVCIKQKFVLRVLLNEVLLY